MNEAFRSGDVVGKSQAMERIMRLVERVASAPSSVLITGESGSGKELIARALHETGERAGKPFVAINCAALPEPLLESELFGHEKGAFTGAHAKREGLFREADGGTLFLDEIGELPLALQVKLLRVIQEKSVRPVGANVEQSLDVRILSATHKPLAPLVEDGRFRHDLFYRINVIELAVPPLRERREDIPALAQGILKRLADDLGEIPPTLSPDAIEALMQYPFPGNVRELENVLERALALSDGELITALDLHLPSARPAAAGTRTTGTQPAVPLVAPGAAPAGALPDYIEQLEREAIVRTLEECRYNKTKAAAKLGITFRAMRYKLKKLGIE